VKKFENRHEQISSGTLLTHPDSVVIIVLDNVNKTDIDMTIFE